MQHQSFFRATQQGHGGDAPRHGGDVTLRAEYGNDVIEDFENARIR